MTPFDRSKDVLERISVRKVLEESNLPIEIATAIADALEAPRPEAARTPEVRLNPDKSLDEVVADNAHFHLEQMDRDHWWLEVESGGKGVSVWLRSKTAIRATYEHRTSQPQGSDHESS